MRAHDIETLVQVGRPTVSADGSFVIFGASRPDITANRAVGQLWRIDLPDGSPRRLTRGTSDSAPRLSPDSSRIAFLREGANSKAQIFVVEAGGGEPVQVSDAPLGVSGFAWAPSGDALAFTARVPEAGRYGTVEGLDASAESPRRVTTVRWHSNAVGYIIDRPAHLFLVPAPVVTAEPTYEPAPTVRPDGAEAVEKRVVPASASQLTDGEASHFGAVFTSDGREVLTVMTREAEGDLRSRIDAVAVDGSGQREILGLDADLAVTDVAVAEDGVIAILASDTGPDGVDFVAPGVALWIVGDAEPRRLTDPETIDLGEVGSHITPLGADFLVQDRTRGRVRLVRASRDGSLTEVLGGDVEVGGHDAAGSRVIAAVATTASFGELVVVTESGSKVLTDFGAVVSATHIAVPTELEITGRAGYPVHGWVVCPTGEGPHPVILQIHGGPYASYGIHLFDETQVLVDAGYAVVYCNPRGSAGYGRAHGRSIRQAMGTLDFADVIDFLDGAIDENPALDGSRVGVMGGSYGGYLTAWVIAHDHRFAGAIVERGFLDPVSFQGTSDIGSFFGDEYIGTDADLITSQSPMAVVDRVSTPTLVLHSELDLRCPLEQATRYYSALKRRGVEAEMLIFPGENHELTRAGQPRHRIERFDAILDWWNRMLPVAS